MLMRPPSSPIIAILKPSPSAPMRLATGTRQFSKITCAVGWLFQPSFFSCLPNDRPGVPVLDHERQEMPPAPLAAGAHHADIDVGGAAAGDERLGAVRARSDRRARTARVAAPRRRSRRPARSGNSCAKCSIERELGQEALRAARRRRSASIIHGGHVVDRDVGRRRGAARRPAPRRSAPHRAASAR